MSQKERKRHNQGARVWPHAVWLKGGALSECERRREGVRRKERGRRWVSHLCSVPDNGRPGVAQFVSTGPFVIVDQEKVILSHIHTHTHKTDKD